jgi:hypothetical protein
MASYFWVGGTGTWSATGNTQFAITSGGIATILNPTSADTVFFDANSGGGTCTLGSDVTCLILTMSNYAGTLDFQSFKITLTGNATQIFAQSLTMGVAGTPIIECSYSGGTGTRTITGTTAGETSTITIKIIAGTDIFAMGSGRRYRTVDFTGFSGSLTNTTRTIFGNLIVSSSMTLTAGTLATTFAATSGTQQITTSAKTLDFPLTFNGIGGTFAFQDALTQGSTRAFTITNGTVQLKNGVTSVVGSFVANNANVKFLQSTTPGSQATLSQASGTVNVVDLTIRDINAVGGASWNAYTDFENTDAGNNDGWNFSLSPPYSTAEFPITLRSFTQPRRF